VLLVMVVHDEVVVVRRGIPAMLHAQHSPPRGPAVHGGVHENDLRDGDVGGGGDGRLEDVGDVVGVAVPGGERHVAQGDDYRDGLGVGALKPRLAGALQEGGAPRVGNGAGGTHGNADRRGAIRSGRAHGTILGLGCAQGVGADRAGRAILQASSAARGAKRACGAVARRCCAARAVLAAGTGSAIARRGTQGGPSIRSRQAVQGRRARRAAAKLARRTGQAHRLVCAGLVVAQATGDGLREAADVAQVACWAWRHSGGVGGAVAALGTDQALA